MLGIIVLLVLSWAILRLFKYNFSVLGLKPDPIRIKTFLIGFSVSALICAIYFIWNIAVLDAQISINKSYNLREFLNAFWWTLKSVLFEELVFRGALLFLAIKYLGKIKACVLSAIIFGVYHWFSYSVFGALVPMIHVFIVTSLGGLMFAFAYTETKSMYFPIALHFGWNLVSIVIFSEGPIGDQVLISKTENIMPVTMYFVFLLYQFILPLFTFWYLRFQYRTES